MEVHTLERLDYDKFLSLLSSYAVTQLGKKLVRALKPKKDPTHELKFVEEAIELIKSSHNLLPSNVQSADVEDVLDRLNAGSVLEPQQLLRLADAIAVTKVLKERLERLPDRFTMKELARSVEPATDLVAKIHGCIDPNGLIKDEASEKLKEIRQQIRSSLEEIRKRSDAFIKMNRTFLQDPICVLKDGRHVFPIKASHRGQVRGIVHGVSASSATCFVEPDEFVPLNNKLYELKEEETKEINRILRELTGLVRQNLKRIEEGLNFVATIDSIHARASFAVDYGAIVVYPSSRRIVHLVQARHPLLDRSRVVPIDLSLPVNKSGLILTGPNTGGKTVSLKTVGLFCCMMKAAIPLPCAHGTEIFGFDSVFVDVGDEQSIEQNLSTFSSHLRNIILALQSADESSLVLIDELGAGTDPVEGAALGLAIIERLKQIGCKFIVTTHLTPIKLRAVNDESLVSASLEFDPETLKPTYRILMGVVGGSHALEIAQKLGLDGSVLQMARDYLGKDYVEVAKVVEEYQKQLVLTKKRIEDLEKERLQLERMKQEYEQKYQELRQKKIEELDRELKQLYDYIKQAKKQVDETIRSIKSKEDLASLRSASKHFEDHAAKVRQIQFEQETVSDSQIDVGDTVRLRNGEAVGKVVEKRGDRYIVDFNGLRLEARKRNLVKVEQVSQQEEVSPSISFELKKPEIDVRGLTVEEAEPLVERFIDDLCLSDFKVGYIIHGKGTGRLAVGIWQILRRDPRVKRYRFGTPNEGGTGVTVVEV
ncbi:endonuclease MutS2 [Thermotoga caldifontis]|uniref:endonuclease MutS2 n=1 Tax=Thermotoga caldifontis TaxID=1508419 RepID=UPI000596F015|nr:endonuclease MutS2 [Thermotoga caldifontis]